MYNDEIEKVNLIKKTINDNQQIFKYYIND